MEKLTANLKPLLELIEANLDKKNPSPFQCHHCRDSGFIRETLNNEPVARKCQACNGAHWKSLQEQPRPPVLYHEEDNPPE